MNTHGGIRMAEDSKYTEETAKAILLSNRGRIESKKITIQQPGIRLLGVIDYLIGKHKYVWVRVRDD